MLKMRNCVSGAKQIENLNKIGPQYRKHNLISLWLKRMKQRQGI